MTRQVLRDEVADRIVELSRLNFTYRQIANELGVPLSLVASVASAGGHARDRFTQSRLNKGGKK